MGQFYGGLTGKSRRDFTDNTNAKYVTYSGIYNNIAVDDGCLGAVHIDEQDRQNRVAMGDVLFTGSSEILEEVAYSSIVVADFADDVYLNSFSIGYRFNSDILVDNNYIKHMFRCDSVRKRLVKTAMGVTRFNVSKERMKRVVVVLPPIDMQTKIADILDRFYVYANDIANGLPAEISLRQKQYEYYRDRLLSFDVVRGD